MALIAIDAGHGGANPGAVYNGRQEKDDVLALALAVGNILEQNGVQVYYTRTSDVYESPYQKAMEGNAVNADYFVSLHRNSSPYPNQYTGVETLVYNRYGEAARLAYNINSRLVDIGFENQGVNERQNLVVLNRTNMPAVLVEVGFINTDADNQLFDERFSEIAAVRQGGYWCWREPFFLLWDFFGAAGKRTAPGRSVRAGSFPAASSLWEAPP